MRIASGWSCWDASGAGLDVDKASDGRFSGDPQAIFGQWDAFREWAAARDRGPNVEETAG